MCVTFYAAFRFPFSVVDWAEEISSSKECACGTQSSVHVRTQKEKFSLAARLQQHQTLLFLPTIGFFRFWSRARKVFSPLENAFLASEIGNSAAKSINILTQLFAFSSQLEARIQTFTVLLFSSEVLWTWKWLKIIEGCFALLAVTSDCFTARKGNLIKFSCPKRKWESPATSRSGAAVLRPLCLVSDGKLSVPSTFFHNFPINFFLTANNRFFPRGTVELGGRGDDNRWNEFSKQVCVCETFACGNLWKRCENCETFVWNF